MIEFEYIKIKFKETKLILLFSFVLSILFSISFIRFSNYAISELGIFIRFFMFIFIILYLRQIFMKIVAYKNGFEIEIRQTHFDRYGLRTYDKISYYSHNIKHNHHYLGIPTSVISILIYIFTLGIIIFPSIWNYSYRKIEHMHLGTRQAWEYEMGHMFNIEVSDYRKSKAIFAGFIFYFIIALFLKSFFTLIGETLFNWYGFILFWIALITILPIPGTEGYDFWRKNNFAWVMAITILILGMLSIFIFKNIIYVVGVTIFTSIIMIFVIFYKKIMKHGH